MSNASDATSDHLTRCTWCGEDELYVAYHDHDWGVPVYDDATLFEILTLEGAQAGLSWLTVLRRREGYRKVFEGFDPQVVAAFDDARVASIIADPRVIRHRQKIASVVTNARAIMAVREGDEHDSFLDYLVHVMDPTLDATTGAQNLSTRLRRDGFNFVGPTICLSFVQAAGIRNDHARECFRYDEIESLGLPH